MRRSSDVARMGEWSEEASPANGTRASTDLSSVSFDGHNRHGDHEWTTQGKVIEADPGRAFAFECSMMISTSRHGAIASSHRIGCTVTEWSEDLRPESARSSASRSRASPTAPARNRQTMRLTLERLAAALGH